MQREFVNRRAPDIELRLRDCLQSQGGVDATTSTGTTSTTTTDTSFVFLSPVESQLHSMLNHPMRVLLTDGRLYQGTLHCIDRENIILTDSRQYKQTSNINNTEDQDIRTEQLTACIESRVGQVLIGLRHIKAAHLFTTQQHIDTLNHHAVTPENSITPSTGDWFTPTDNAQIDAAAHRSER